MSSSHRALTGPTLRDFFLFSNPPHRLDFFRSTFRADAHNRARTVPRPWWGPSGKYLQLTSLRNKRIRHRVHGPANPVPAGKGVTRDNSPLPARPSKSNPQKPEIISEILTIPFLNF